MTNEQFGKIQQIEGFIDPEEGIKLNKLATSVTEGVILEIGSYKGRSTCYLAIGAKVPVYAIDMWDLFQKEHRRWEKFSITETLDTFKANLESLNLKVTYIRGISFEIAKIWNFPIGMLFIDGNHSYEGCRADINGYSPHLIKGGIIALHDYQSGEKYKGVVRAANEIKPLFTDWQITNSLIVGRNG